MAVAPPMVPVRGQGRLERPVQQALGQGVGQPVMRLGRPGRPVQAPGQLPRQLLGRLVVLAAAPLWREAGRRPLTSH